MRSQSSQSMKVNYMLFCPVQIMYKKIYSKDTQILLSCVETPTSEIPVETDSGGESDAVGESEVGEESVRTRGRGRGRGKE
jgi:hypothetical protein